MMCLAGEDQPHSDEGNSTAVWRPCAWDPPEHSSHEHHASIAWAATDGVHTSPSLLVAGQQNWRMTLLVIFGIRNWYHEQPVQTLCRRAANAAL